MFANEVDGYSSKKSLCIDLIFVLVYAKRWLCKNKNMLEDIFRFYYHFIRKKNQSRAM